MSRDIKEYTEMLWVHTPHKAFGNETGFVPCTPEEYEKYKDSDIAQDTAHGANHFYEIKVMAPKKGASRKPQPAKDDEPEDDSSED